MSGMLGRRETPGAPSEAAWGGIKTYIEGHTKFPTPGNP